MKFHEFNDFLSDNGSSESEIERLRKAQAEIRRMKKRRILVITAVLFLATISVTVYLLIHHGNDTTQQAQPQPRRGS